MEEAGRLKVPHTFPSLVIDSFFVLGLFSALMFRILILFTQWQVHWFRPVWYAGVVGYVFFFAFRYYISRKRRKVIADYRLAEKLKDETALSREDRDALLYIVDSIRKSRENINYLFIFGLSCLAILLDLWMHW
ncbi:hypothetical protein LZ24_00117 [Desulfobotulus alkaliphilus]|uniref:Uncharacterized protein n=1 Tax=Desulfobotulus alkaliphilus TaxID=622671 RepID=A0A562S808_9BACT|nr:hypothetical protein [Desulfobotulus alkaliphilus]TWI77313.1 hypothetical protein LZ24_00117 [Desulfobotulus alkaliphilus]